MSQFHSVSLSFPVARVKYSILLLRNIIKINVISFLNNMVSVYKGM